MLVTSYSCSGSGQILEIERRTIPLPSLILTTREIPSVPGCNFTMRPNCHLVGGKLSSFIRTKAPHFTLAQFFFHLHLCCSSEMYSFDQRDQKSCDIFWNCWYLDNLFSARSSTFGSGTVVNGRPIKKCAGVSGKRSMEFDDKGDKGLELSTHSICVKI